ncbi:HAD-IA family hydrolase [Actinomycetes bacterium KLBMP 9797]
MALAAVIWDIDDTLVNTRSCHIRCQRLALRDLGVAAWHIDAALRVWNELYWYFDRSDHVGILLALAGELGLDNADEDLIRVVASRMSYPWDACLMPKPGVVGCLDHLANAGVPLGIVSNGRPELQRLKLEKTRLDRYFPPTAVAVATPGGETAKPRPHAILACCATLGVPPRSCLYVGDRRSDVVAANIAGVRPVLIPSGMFEFKEPTTVTLGLERPFRTFATARDFHRWIAHREPIGPTATPPTATQTTATQTTATNRP